MNSFSLKRLIQRLTGLGRDRIEAISRSRLSASEQMTGLCRSILDLRGEAAAVTIAEELHILYQDTPPEERLLFLQALAEEFSPSQESVDKAIETYRQTPDNRNLMVLNRATESPRQELFRTLNMAPEATAALIAFREDLLGFLPEHPELDLIDQDLLHLFRSWFNRGFLELKRIDWQTPALILEKLIEYESVHEIKGWDDLRRRLQDDRRCFGFFHPVIPHIPLIFVEVALTRDMSTNIATLLDDAPPNDEEEPRAAVFYSINNCLTGLRGVSFGNLLIKQVVASLAAEFPGLKTYATLSPVPGFVSWLGKNTDDLAWIGETEKNLVMQAISDAREGKLETGNEELKSLTLRLCADYLLNAKSRGKPANAVARFHLGNGASLERINWAGDLSANGQKQALGLMVNYVYDRNMIARNHEAYESRDEVCCSDEVRKLLDNSN